MTPAEAERILKDRLGNEGWKALQVVFRGDMTVSQLNQWMPQPDLTAEERQELERQLAPVRDLLEDTE